MRRILITIGDLTHDDSSMSIPDSVISRETSLPDYELGKILNELDSLGLIKILPKPSGVDFWLVTITPKGLLELRSHKDN